MYRVCHTEPQSPSRFRPGLSIDLEAVCLKCLEKEPRRRYQAAASLAADLRRWLAHEPTLARPISPPVGLWRWARRKPMVASLLATLLVALVTLVGVMTWSRTRIAAALATETELRGAAETARVDALES